MAVLGLTVLPALLRWHHAALILVWNMSLVFALLPGHPDIQLIIFPLSFTIAALQHILRKQAPLLNVPSVTRSLIALGLVALVTARLTGGIGLQALGSEAYGGRKYVSLFVAILGYFALTAQPIETEKAPLFVKMYFLGGLTVGVSMLVPLAPNALWVLFLFFPGDTSTLGSASSVLGYDPAIPRLVTMANVGATLFCTLLATYGIRECLQMRKAWRWLALLGCVVISAFGGFRTALFSLLLVFLIMFYFEGLFRGGMILSLVLGTVLAGSLLVPVANKLPLSVQRTLSFLPLPLDQVAVMDAEGSTEWRLGMWKSLLPEVPKHLLLGKGYSIDANALSMLSSGMTRGAESWQIAAVTGDYHSGPLSVILTFGIWGTIAFIWFIWAGIRTLYRNYLFGEVRLKTINTFLLSYFIAKVIGFVFIFGGLNGDLVCFTGLIGLSVCLNKGERSPEPASDLAPVMAWKRPRLVDSTT
jgi:hypothetical protein